MLKTGAAGSKEGDVWEDEGYTQISQIFISYKPSQICYVRFQYVDDDGNFILSPLHGCDKGDSFSVINVDFEDNEFLVGLSGKYEANFHSCLNSLTFETNKRKYGPFGSEKGIGGSNFHIQLHDVGFHRSFCGFHGTADPNDGLTSIANREQKRRKESHSNSSIGPPSVKSFLSTIPAPKNSFSSLGGGRRSAIDTQTPTSAAPEESKVETHPTSNSGHLESEAASYAGYESGVAHDDALNTQPPTYSGSEAYGAENHSTSNYGDFDPNAASYVNYETGYDQNPGQHVDAGYGSYEGYGHQNSNSWGGGSMAAAIPHSESALRILGKRSKIPAEIVEVKQDELMKNRPREDQSKMTGIAFGPSYQPVSSKGKPTKLHKRKHQIGSLFFDMKQKETELAERRSKGFLTKAETHAKYGW